MVSILCMPTQRKAFAIVMTAGLVFILMKHYFALQAQNPKILIDAYVQSIVMVVDVLSKTFHHAIVTMMVLAYHLMLAIEQTVCLCTQEYFGRYCEKNSCKNDYSFNVPGSN